jgi:hypothetical protein
MLSLGILGELTVALSDLSHTRLISVTSRKTLVVSARHEEAK